LPDRRTLILFERHVFHEQTAGMFDASHPRISSAAPGGYRGGAREYERLDEAIGLNRTAALASASWGICQVMGYNAKMAGFASVEDMVSAMRKEEDEQLAAAARFLRERKLHALLTRHDWTAFARAFNGPNFREYLYDTRLAAAYAAFSSGLLPDIRVRQAQMLLMFAGIDAGAVDGIAGKRTRSAVVEFRQRHGLGNSSVIDDELLRNLVPV
jgi:hypothetical protein